MNVGHIQAEKAFDVIGISLRTTNKAAVAEGTIGSLWQQFFAQDIFARIPNKIDNAIIAVYYDFESDKSGAYSLLIGARVSSTEVIPAGLDMLHVPAQKRSVFVSQKGPQGVIVFDLWKQLWTLEESGQLNRSYTADYELYDERSLDPQHAQVAIHIGIQ